ncbi:MAG: hypothetical protein QM504_05550 [Pseudomonadota bacterium]
MVKCVYDNDYIIEDKLPAEIFDAILLLVPHNEVVNELKVAGSILMHEHSIFFSLDLQYSDLLK